MKIAVAIFLLSVFTWAEKAPINPAAYTVTIHVRASRMVNWVGSGPSASQLDVVIDGKKYELEGPYYILLALGDYKAKLVQDEHKTAYESLQSYEFLFPDNKTLKYQVVGQTE